MFGFTSKYKKRIAALESELACLIRETSRKDAYALTQSNLIAHLNTKNSTAISMLTEARAELAQLNGSLSSALEAQQTLATVIDMQYALIDTYCPKEEKHKLAWLVMKLKDQGKIPAKPASEDSKNQQDLVVSNLLETVIDRGEIETPINTHTVGEAGLAPTQAPGDADLLTNPEYDVDEWGFDINGEYQPELHQKKLKEKENGKTEPS